MKRFKNILFVADGGAEQEQAFSRAMALAAANQSKVTVIDVIQDLASLPQHSLLIDAMDFDQDKLLEEHRAALKKMVTAGTENTPGVPVTIEIRQGRLFIETIRAVQDNGHDLVMKSTNTDVSPLQRLLGSTDLRLLRKCPCPVWIVRSSEGKRLARILAAIDPDLDNPDAAALNKLILDLATSLAEIENSELDVLHAWKVEGEVALRGAGQVPSSALNAILDDMREAHRRDVEQLLAPYQGFEKQVHVVKGNAGEVITEFTRGNNIDLVVMGTVGRSGIPGLIIGNTAEKVITSIDCSVLAVKPEHFVTPVLA